MTRKVSTKKSKKFVEQIFKDIPKYIDGSKSDRYRIGSKFWGTLTRELFKRIYEAFKIKSEGGTDSLGNKWKPLSPSTIATRPLGKNNLREFGLTKDQSGTSFNKRSRGLLTPQQDQLWRSVFAKTARKLMLTLNEDEAKSEAAKRAWGLLKKKGAMTRKDLLSNRNVLIMRVTDRIYNSLRPAGGSGKYRPIKDQLYEQSGNTLRIGTTVEYASYHDDTRPVIPENIDPWVDQSVEIAMNDVYNHIIERVL